MEVIGIIIGILGLIIAFIALKKDHYSKPKEELKHLQVQFRATQNLSKKVQEDLEDLIVRNNAYNSEIFPGITYKDYLITLKETYSHNLSDERYYQISEVEMGKSTIQSMTHSIETQFNALSEIHSQILLLSKHH